MKTLLLARDEAWAAPLVPVLEQQGIRVAVWTSPVIDDAAAGCEAVFVDIALGVDTVTRVAQRFSGPGGALTAMLAVIGEPSSAAELDAFMAAGAHTWLPPDVATLGLRARILSSSVRTYGRYTAVFAKLRESEARYRSVVDALDEGVIVQSADGAVLTTNKSAERLLGISTGDVFARRWRGADWKITRPDGSIVTADELPSIVALRTGEPVRGFVIGMRDPEGVTRWLSVNSQPVRGADGEVTMTVTSMTDITSRQRAHENLRNLLSSAPDGILVHRDAIALFVNRPFCELLGYDDPKELVGRHMMTFLPARYHEIVKERIRLRAAGRGTPPIDHPMLRRDGSEVMTRVTGLPTLWEGAEANIAYVRDLSEQKRLESRLADADRFAALGRLSASVGHEINNPLAYLIASLKREQTESGRRSSHVAEALDAAERVRRIVKDLKTAAKAGHDDPIEVVELDAVLDTCARMTRAPLERELASSARRVLGSEPRLVQLFTNLVVNAVEAGTRVVRVVARRSGDAIVEIDVIDDGCGIADDDLPHVFEPLFTTKRSRGGTGIGLGVCNAIVRALAGEMSITSEPNRGTTVTVRLAAAPPDAPLPRPASSRPTAGPRRRRVLIVDDEPKLAGVIREYLGDDDVGIATSGREAITHLESGTDLDAILCDLMLPDLDGVAIHTWVGQHRPELSRRMIFMTGGAFTKRGSEFLARAEAPCLEKPFDIDALVELLDRVTSQG